MRSPWPATRRAAARTPHSWPARCCGELHYERGELDEAERLLEESRELGAESGVVDFMIASYALLARIKAHRGATADAAELLAEGAKVAERLGLTRLRAAVLAERIRQLLAARRLPEARWIAQDLPDGGGCHGGIGLAIDQIRTAALASVLSAEGDHDGARALLEELIAELDRRGQVRASVAAAVALTAVAERAARRMAAERSLASALSRCLPAGLRQPVLDGGPEVAAVLSRLVTRAEAGTWPGTGPPIAVAVLADLLAHAAPPGRGVADLNARELAVLRMLDVGRSNQQIGRALGVTVNTVKWYLKNIYAKLGVASRAEAVSTARRAGSALLIPRTDGSLQGRVQRPLEVLVGRPGPLGDERQRVRVDRCADPRGAVDEEVGVEQPGPGTGAGPAHAREVRGVQQQAVAPLPARAGVEGRGDRRVGGRDLRGEVQVTDLVGEGGIDRLLRQDPLAVQLTAPQQRPLEPDVVARRGVQPVSARPPVGRPG